MSSGATTTAEDECTIHTIGDTQILAYHADRDTGQVIKLAMRAARKHFFFKHFRGGSFERVGDHGLLLSRVIENRSSARKCRGKRPVISIEKHCLSIAVMEFSCILSNPKKRQYICWQEPVLEQPDFLCIIDRKGGQCFFIDSGILQQRPEGGALIFEEGSGCNWKVAPATLDEDHAIHIPGPYAHMVEHHDVQKDSKSTPNFFDNRTISTTDEAYLRAVCLASYVKGGNGKISLNLCGTPCRVRNWRVQNWSTKIGKWRPLLGRQMTCELRGSVRSVAGREVVDLDKALPDDMDLDTRYHALQLAREQDKHSFWQKVCSANPDVDDGIAIMEVLNSTVLVGYPDDRYPDIDYHDERVQWVAREYHKRFIEAMADQSGKPGNRELLLAERATGSGVQYASVELDEPLDSCNLHMKERIMLMNAIGDSVGISPSRYLSGARLADAGSGRICRVCDHCHTALKKLSLCGGCGHVSYCNQTCQQMARPGHKMDCHQWSSLIDEGVQKILKHTSYPECSVLFRAFGDSRTWSGLRITAELQTKLEKAFPQLQIVRGPQDDSIPEGLEPRTDHGKTVTQGSNSHSGSAAQHTKHSSERVQQEAGMDWLKASCQSPTTKLTDLKVAPSVDETVSRDEAISSFLWHETVSRDYDRTVSVEFALNNKLPGSYIDGLSMRQAIAVIHSGGVAIRRLRNSKLNTATEHPAEMTAFCCGKISNLRIAAAVTAAAENA